MSRYFTRQGAAPSGDDYDPLLPSLSVDDHVPVTTGLIDRNGNPIMRAPNRVGFHHPKGSAL